MQYLKKLNYDVILKKKGENFVIYIPELSCIAEDASLEKAYKKLEIEKEKYFKGIIESDFIDYINEPENLTIKKTVIFTSFTFIIKGVIIFTMIFLLGLIASYTLGDIVKTISHQSIKNEAGIFFRKIDEMPEGKKEELKLRLRKTIKQLKPFIDEFKIFSDKTDLRR